MSSVGAFMSIVFFKNITSDVRNLQFAICTERVVRLLPYLCILPKASTGVLRLHQLWYSRHSEIEWFP